MSEFRIFVNVFQRVCCEPSIWDNCVPNLFTGDVFYFDNPTKAVSCRWEKVKSETCSSIVVAKGDVIERFR